MVARHMMCAMSVYTEYWEPIDAANMDFRRDNDGNLDLHQIEEAAMWESSERYIPQTKYSGPTYAMDEVLSSPALGGAFL